jgi:DNA topoisomerase-1
MLLGQTQKLDQKIANYNKKQFWSYKRLNELNKSKTNTDNNDTTKKKSKKSIKIIKNKKKKVFHIINNKVVTDKTIIERLDKIYIPPAYKDLVVAKSETNKIQVIGTDNRGRRQYIYNPTYTKKRNSRKYDDVMDLGKSIIKIEKDNTTMLNELNKKIYSQWVLPDDYIPIIIYMLRTYNFRIGNECYANDNDSYGITTLKKEHIFFLGTGKSGDSSKFKIEFVGKKGIINTYTDKNQQISNLLKILIKNASSDGYIFKYETESNKTDGKQLITPDHIHTFFQEKYNAYITPKMFRTWYGNFHMLNYLNKIFKENKLKPKMLKSEVRDLVKSCSEHVSDKLNNTPSISKKSYIDNKILDLVIKNPYKFASSIPNSIEEQHDFLYKIIMKLRH